MRVRRAARPNMCASTPLRVYRILVAKVKIALVMDDERDLSDLVDELLRGWLAERN